MGGRRKFCRGRNHCSCGGSPAACAALQTPLLQQLPVPSRLSTSALCVCTMAALTHTLTEAERGVQHMT